MEHMELSTLDAIPGYKISRHFGMVTASCLVSQTLTKDFTAALKALQGREVEEYQDLTEQSREQALQRMVVQARQLGANAIVGVRFASSAIMSGCAEWMVYGTAVEIHAE